MKFDVQKEKYIEEKNRIALAASALIEEEDVILIEAGTTGYQTALNITNRAKLTVITNSCDIAVLLGKSNPGYKIILSGGMLNIDTHALVGPIADFAFKTTFVDKAFIGISGIDLEKGITAADPIEAQTKRNIISCAKQVIALADHSKIGHVAMNYVAPISSINIFITDSKADEVFMEKLRDIDIRVIVK
jgi:DeoR family fructose operon transcriptional repressor